MATSGLALAGSLQPASSLVSGAGNLIGGSAGSSPAALSLGGVVGGTASAVPEPSAIVLLLIAACGLGLVRRSSAFMRKRTAA
jgi:hypothetical protein